MIIERIEIKSFGQLTDTTLEFSDTINIIEGQNEAGKSTIAAFIKYMLYGFEAYTANQVKKFFKQHSANGNLVLFSSHNLDVVEKLCDRVYIIDQGRILEEINIREFKESDRGDLEDYFLSITKRVAKV